MRALGTGPFLLLTGAAVLAPGCTGVLGLNDEHSDPVAEVCSCDKVYPLYGSAGACRAELGERLKLATESTRAQWMQRFTEHCTNCTNPLECVSYPPTCRQTGEACAGDLAGSVCCSKKCSNQKCG
jgi:hypothetical protein